MIELQRHIEILLLSNDCVIVPGLGAFVAHHVDARYEENEALFLPPLRTLGFNPQLSINDSLLVHSYIEAYDTSYPEALRRIESEVGELRNHIETEGSYELYGLGTLRLGEEGALLFEPCEAGILSPLLYGLGSLGIRPLVAAPAPVVEAPTGEAADEAADSPADNAIVIRMSWLRNIAAAAAAVIAFVMLTGTPVSNSLPATDTQQSAFISLPQTAKTEAIATEEAPEAAEASAEASEAEAEGPAVVDEVAAVEEELPLFTLVMASQVSRANAEAYVQQLIEAGYDEARVDVNRNNIVRVVYGSFASEEEAVGELRRLRGESSRFRQSWVMKM